MFNCDVFIEVGHGPTLIDNNVLLSKASVIMPSEGLAVIHNLMCGAFGLINSGVDSIVNGQREPRYTPYHIRHRTEVAGFMTILHGDDRVYNNIIVQKYPVTDPSIGPDSPEHQAAGTAPFDIFPSYDEWIANFMMDREPDMGHLAQYHFGHLPVWIGGNAYFGGATVSKHEKTGLVNTADKVTVEVAEADGKWTLDTNVYDLLGDFRDAILTTESLGRAFQPEQRFENPDGTPIAFDRDFLGNHRGVDALPGPFAKRRGREGGFGVTQQCGGLDCWILIWGEWRGPKPSPLGKVDSAKNACIVLPKTDEVLVAEATAVMTNVSRGDLIRPLRRDSPSSKGPQDSQTSTKLTKSDLSLNPNLVTPDPFQKHHKRNIAMKKILVYHPRLTDSNRRDIEKAAGKYGHSVVFCDDADAALREAADAEIILSADPTLPGAAPELKWMCCAFAGVEPLLVPGAFANPRALLTNASGAYGVTIAEHIVMVALELMRRQMDYNRVVAAREWVRDLPIRSIRGSRVTLLGAGDIGREAAKRLRAFGPKRIVAVNRSGRDAGACSTKPCRCRRWTTSCRRPTCW